MPLPFAVPTMRAPLERVTCASLDRVSVVMMAVAKGSAAPSSSSGRCSTPLSTLSIGSRWPMTPVDAVMTSASPTASTLARASAMSALSRAPCCPVAAFATPALTTRARSGAPLAYSSRLRVTQAAAVVERVPAKAQAQSRSLTTQLRSGLPLGLMPAAIAAARKPWGKVTSGKGSVMAARVKPRGTGLAGSGLGSSALPAAMRAA